MEEKEEEKEVEKEKEGVVDEPVVATGGQAGGDAAEVEELAEGVAVVDLKSKFGSKKKKKPVVV